MLDFSWIPLISLERMSCAKGKGKSIPIMFEMHFHLAQAPRSRTHDTQRFPGYRGGLPKGGLTPPPNLRQKSKGKLSHFQTTLRSFLTELGQLALSLKGAEGPGQPGRLQMRACLGLGVNTLVFLDGLACRPITQTCHMGPEQKC